MSTQDRQMKRRNFMRSLATAAVAVVAVPLAGLSFNNLITLKILCNPFLTLFLNSAAEFWSLAGTDDFIITRRYR